MLRFRGISLVSLILSTLLSVNSVFAESNKFNNKQKKYAVVLSAATKADSDWGQVSARLVKKYNAREFVFDQKPLEILKDLRSYFPYYVCFVTRPDELYGKSTFIADAARVVRSLDDDCYEDAIWAILTGIDAKDAMRIISSPPLTVRKALSHVGNGCLEWFDEGTSFSEGEKNAKFVKKPGEPVKKVAGPDETTAEFTEVLNRNDCNIISTSGHATEKDWQMGYSFRSGQIKPKDGKLFAIQLDGKMLPITADNPKIYFGIGNCLIGHVLDKDCMALTWIHNGANQFFGHIVPQSRPCYAWAICEYFYLLQDRFSFAEAVYIHSLARIYETSKLGVDYPCCNVGGKSSILYGDPAWDARMKKTVDPLYDQNLIINTNGNKLSITFEIKANKDGGISRPPVALLPIRIKNAEVESTNAKQVEVADNFILMRVWDKNDPPLKAGETRKVKLTAERIAE